MIYKRIDDEWGCLSCGFKGSRMQVQNHCDKIHHTVKKWGQTELLSK